MTLTKPTKLTARKVMTRVSIVFSLALMLGVVAPLPVSAQSRNDVCIGVGGATGGAADCTAPAGATTVNDVVRVAINLLSLVVGIVSVIMLIFGGYKYATSAGDSGKIASAQQTIIYALVGVVIVAMSQTIVRFVLTQATVPPPPPPPPGASIILVASKTVVV